MWKKHSITLVEILISLTLITLLFTTLFFWYRHLHEKKGELTKLKQPYLEEYHAWQRLQEILPKAQHFFLGEGSTMVFCFDRGISRNPKLSNTVLGKIYHDPIMKTLCLAVWPNPIQYQRMDSPSLNLTLLDGVEPINTIALFEFYLPPDPFKKPIDPKGVDLSDKEGWNKEWNSSKLPAFVRINFLHYGKEKAFYFDLNQKIFYPLVKG
ncbi:MAG: DUF1494 domain-containing protein [Chlamydiales bacterium]